MSAAARSRSARAEIGRLGHLLDQILCVIAGIVLMAMVLLTTVDVIGRYLFASPIRGAFEITTMLLAMLIFLALPLACERDEHVVVDLLDHVTPQRFRRIQVVFADVVSAAVLAFLAWELFARGQSLTADGFVTLSLRLPLAPAAFVMAAMALLSALVMVVKIGAALRGPLPEAHHTAEV